MKLFLKFMLFFSFILLPGFVLPVSAWDASIVMDLFKKVESIGLSRNGYTLGGILNDKQKKIAVANLVPSGTDNTYKFRDRGLNLVVDVQTNRIVLIYEQFDSLSQKQIKELAGALLLDFGEPTVVAHDSLFYWAYEDGGKLEPEAFDKAKAARKSPGILATVKFNSQIPIMEENGASANGTAYYIISSNPLLVYFKP